MSSLVEISITDKYNTVFCSTQHKLLIRLLSLDMMISPLLHLRRRQGQGTKSPTLGMVMRIGNRGLNLHGCAGDGNGDRDKRLNL